LGLGQTHTFTISQPKKEEKERARGKQMQQTANLQTKKQSGQRANAAATTSQPGKN
jgi:hypothetical protein